MKRTKLPISLLMLGALLPAATAQPQNFMDARVEPPHRGQQAPQAGFWPTDRMIELFIDRFTENLSGAYNFDDDQLQNTRALIKERIPGWLQQNRSQLMQLTNEFVESAFGDQPPDPAQVAGWAQRALPLLQDFTQLTDGIADDMRPFLTEDQQTILNGQRAARNVVLQNVTGRLANWSEGGFDPETEWIGNPEARKKRREDDRRIHEQATYAEKVARGELPPDGSNDAGAAGSGAAGGAAGGRQSGKQARAGEKTAGGADEWAQYVENFIRRYRLNEEQKSSAYRILKARQEERDNYLRRSGARLAEADKRVKEAKTDPERAAAAELVKQHARPLNRMFETLKEQLDKIPTRAQRIAAANEEAQRAVTKSPAAKDAGAGQTGAAPGGAQTGGGTSKPPSDGGKPPADSGKPDGDSSKPSGDR